MPWYIQSLVVALGILLVFLTYFGVCAWRMMRSDVDVTEYVEGDLEDDFA